MTDEQKNIRDLAFIDWILILYLEMRHQKTIISKKVQSQCFDTILKQFKQAGFSGDQCESFFKEFEQWIRNRTFSIQLLNISGRLVDVKLDFADELEQNPDYQEMQAVFKNQPGKN